VFRDSAGIVIAENWLPPTEAEPIRPEVMAVIAPDPSAEAALSGMIAGAVRTGEQQVIIADARTSSLALFDSAGKFIRLLGRKGEGPGEYQDIMSAFRIRGDTIGVIDLQYGRRLTTLLSDGTLLESKILPLEPITRSADAIPNMLGHPRFVVGVMADGAMLAYIRTELVREAPGNGQSKVYHDTLIVQRIDRTSGSVERLARLRHGEPFDYESAQGDLWNGWVPFSSRAKLIVGGSGYVFGSAEKFEVARFSPVGQLLQLDRICLGPITVQPVHMEGLLAQHLATAEDRDQNLIRDAFAAAPLRSTGPAYADMLADPDGWLWIGDPHLENGPQLWRVLDPTGALRATVEIEAGVRVVEVGESHLLGIKTDGDDLQTVVVYRWQRPPTAGT